MTVAADLTALTPSERAAYQIGVEARRQRRNRAQLAVSVMLLVVGTVGVGTGAWFAGGWPWTGIALGVIALLAGLYVSLSEPGA